MKWLLRSIPIVALVCVSCTTTTNTTVSPVSNSLAPTITGFSPDTVWTGKWLTIHGTDFGYNSYDIRVFIDTAFVEETDAEDTIMTVSVPEGARTGLIRVWAYEQTATSAKPVVVEYTFNPHSVNVTAPDGGSFSVPGTGMNNYHGVLRLFVGEIPFPIDSVFPNRIVSHVPHNSPGGTMTMSDSNGTYSAGSLTVTRPSSWTTLSQIYNYINVTETHYHYKYTNGQANLDSTWTTKASYAGQRDTNIAGIKFVRATTGLYYSAGPCQIAWDTIKQTAVASFGKYSYAPTTSTHSLDTEWQAGGQTQAAPLPVDDDIEFVLPGFGYQINEDSTNTQGLTIWQKVTSTTLTSGEYDIIFKH
jgi:hypothetical protein